MNPSDSKVASPTKVGLAFAAGILVALAGAVLYVRTSSHPQATAAAANVSQANQPESLSAHKADEPTPVEAKPAIAPLPETSAPETAKRVVSQPSLAKHSTGAATHKRHSKSVPSQPPSSIRVEVSQLNPSTSTPALQRPNAVPPPARAVNEDVNPGGPPPPPPSESAYRPAPPQPHVVTLQLGTNLVVRLGETLSTEHNYSGDTFRATLQRPIVMDGFVIADRGSKVLGRVVDAIKPGKFEGVANLQLALTEINTTDGQRVRVETDFVSRKGSSRAKEETAKIAGGAALGAIIGAIAGGGKGAAIGAGAGGAAGTGAVLLGKGKPATIENETELTFQLSSAATITEHIN